MAAPTKESVSIELPKLDIQLVGITLVGDSPLIVHAWSEKAKRAMLDKQRKKAKGAKEAKDPRLDFEQSLYKLDNGFGFNVARRKLDMVNAAKVLSDLRAPPQNHLEALERDRVGQHSIRVNDQWRVCFVWTEAGPKDVEIADYH